jgi:hypothetical protein
LPEWGKLVKSEIERFERISWRFARLRDLDVLSLFQTFVLLFPLCNPYFLSGIRLQFGEFLG